MVDLSGDVRHYTFVGGDMIEETFPVKTLAGEDADLSGYTAHGAFVGSATGVNHGGTYTIDGSSVRMVLTGAETAVADDLVRFQIEVRLAGEPKTLIRGTFTKVEDLVP